MGFHSFLVLLSKYLRGGLINNNRTLENGMRDSDQEKLQLEVKGEMEIGARASQYTI